MASITKRGKSWQIRVSYTDENGSLKLRVRLDSKPKKKLLITAWN
ncbi:hypothetical protein [Pediococcus argentinicus]|nr:hypothetical protein [Pediococcus argentinicus]GEP19175.1 hypothetical protein LSA03_05590 [Pediococcus argentinicus]